MLGLMQTDILRSHKTGPANVEVTNEYQQWK